MKILRSAIILALSGFLFRCDADAEQGLLIFSHTFDFNEGTLGWEADFTEYPAGISAESDSVYRWIVQHTEFPAANPPRKSLMLSAENVHGDMFLFMKRKLEGFQPNTAYTIVFEVELASNASSGSKVYLKAGASPLEPKKVIESNYYSLNIDSGSLSARGEDVIVLGSLETNAGAVPYSFITKSNSNAHERFIVRSNSRGEIWLITGTHSGYRGLNTTYYSRVSAVLSVSN